MKFPLFIAIRYLIAKKSNNIINWITGISVAVIAIVTCALVIILSAMNGLSETVKNLYANFDPDIKVYAKEGKFTDIKLFKLEELKQLKEIENLDLSIEETVLLKYKDNQEIATIKGVGDNFKQMTQIDDFIIDGFFGLHGGGRQMCVIGSELAWQLGINIGLPQSVGIFIPNLDGNYLIEGDFFKSIHPKPVGVFDINTDFNDKYILVSFDYASKLLELNNEASALEIKLSKNTKENDAITKIQGILGEQFEIKTRFELNEFLFKSINTEKWITLLILSLIVVLAIFNVIGSLTMLIIDKKRDIFVLKAMGAKLKSTQLIFWLEGCLIAISGALIGCFLGWLICYLQIQFCFLDYGVGKINCFPIAIEYMDLLISIVVVFVISAIFTSIPVYKIKND